jgi:RNA polymerase sigma-70 factor (ECF subfamily)
VILHVLAEHAGARSAPFDEARWAVLVRMHGAFLQRAIARLGGTGPHVDDIVQEAFISAFRRSADLPLDDNMLRAWLFRAAKNHLLHHRRTLARELRKAEAVVIDNVAPIDSFSERERAALVRKATLALPLELREAFVLVDLEGLSAIDAAGVAGVPENTLRSRLRRARTRFGATLGRIYAPG